MKYLGAQISGDGRIESEISQKIGNAKLDFKILNGVWQHSNLTQIIVWIGRCMAECGKSTEIG
eukprot:1913568-Karenia_brevis.AAC.1